MLNGLLKTPEVMPLFENSVLDLPSKLSYQKIWFISPEESL